VHVLGSRLKKFDKEIYVGILLVILAVTLVGGYYYFLQPMRTAHIMIGGVILSVELAETISEQVKGLSGRDNLPPDHGMLFVFDHPDYWGFWMTQMKFPLDIIWFSANRSTIFIKTNLEPCTPNSCPIYVPTSVALYVLEVNAGFVAAHNITIGTTFTYLSY
jgi:uncharacterized membrane protein (UPF0127 family)